MAAVTTHDEQDNLVQGSCQNSNWNSAAPHCFRFHEGMISTNGQSGSGIAGTMPQPEIVSLSGCCCENAPKESECLLSASRFMFFD